MSSPRPSLPPGPSRSSTSPDLLQRQRRDWFGIPPISMPNGPLLDSSGNLIGVNTAIYSPSGASSGVGFSIPVDTVGGIVDQLIKFGKVTRPILGIKFAPDQSVEQLGLSGVLVLDAPPKGPAGKAHYSQILPHAIGCCSPAMEVAAEAGAY
ncbi:hypothetical protein ZWY2020_057871 [Hordeum vulgare]|nr:hypothetical protein ZWY2020_057871 [Hordeum vulgare]